VVVGDVFYFIFLDDIIDVVVILFRLTFFFLMGIIVVFYFETVSDSFVFILFLIFEFRKKSMICCESVVGLVVFYLFCRIWDDFISKKHEIKGHIFKIDRLDQKKSVIVNF
jgi:uncharacterized membrane protein